MRLGVSFVVLLVACSPEVIGSPDGSSTDTGGRGDIGSDSAARDTGGREDGGIDAMPESGVDARRDSSIPGIETTAADCMDEIDNDGDGLIDCDDPGCIRSCFDGGSDDAGMVDRCVVSDGMDAIGECEESAPPDSFTPDVQWTFMGMGTDVVSAVTPLVANLTDDDDNGSIDLCDTPDVLVVLAAGVGARTVGHIYILDGETGALNLRISAGVDASVTPAIGDIDDDGIPEIVTIDTTGRLVAFEHDGTMKWTGGGPWTVSETYAAAPYVGAIALGDADNDGDVEIAVGNMFADHLGTVLWTASDPSPPWAATAMADLDGDGDLEVVTGTNAYHHTGAVYYRNPSLARGFPQIADLDGDGLPEVLVTSVDGITVLEHDGTLKYGPIRPTGAPAGITTWIRPATIHDFDGDGDPEYAVSSASSYTVYQPDGTIEWSATVSDSSGIAAGTAFDFLGDGIAEAMYADETTLFVFDGEGTSLLSTPRSSVTLSEYPVVADVDDDGSAEIVVVSNRRGATSSPAVQVIRDREDRWIQARRIWNQHTYHVTNVREDGTIPSMEPPSHLGLNTYRTNAQIEGGMLCNPNLI